MSEKYSAHTAQMQCQRGGEDREIEREKARRGQNCQFFDGNGIVKCTVLYMKTAPAQKFHHFFIIICFLI